MEFEDNGIGIAEEYINKVFDMFFRATQSNEGAGLGLYIVQEAVYKLKGKIHINSTLQKGTSFRIEIPNYLVPDIEKPALRRSDKTKEARAV